MKRLILFPCFVAINIASYAQDACSKDNAVYKFQQNTEAKEIDHYGTAPEFPVLRNMTTVPQFVAAMHKQQGKNGNELNAILMGIGFTRGAKDVKESSVTAERLAEGRIGNMGSAGNKYVYAKLEGEPSGVKAWKVTGENGCFVYFIAKCGNAFYPQPAAVQESAAVTDEPQPSPEIAQPVCKDKVYIYYGGVKKKHHGWDVYADDVVLQKCSSPAENTEMVTASDQPVNVYTVTTDVSVETSREYTGYRRIERKDDRESKKEFNREYKHRKYCGCSRN